jgi:hypothetical protein
MPCKKKADVFLTRETITTTLQKIDYIFDIYNLDRRPIKGKIKQK